MKKSKSIDITYRGVDLTIKYDVLNNSFDHQFGTEKLNDFVEITGAEICSISIYELFSDDQIDEITELINAKLGE